MIEFLNYSNNIKYLYAYPDVKVARIVGYIVSSVGYHHNTRIEAYSVHTGKAGPRTIR